LSKEVAGSSDHPLGWHFTNCFSNPFELYWKIKTRNWILPEKSMQYCEDAFRVGIQNLHLEPEFAELGYFLPTHIGMTSAAGIDVPRFMKQNSDKFPRLQ